MYSRAHGIAEKDDEYTIRYFDNRSPQIKAQMDEELKHGDLQLYRGPSVDEMPKPKHVTADFTSGVSTKGGSPKVVDAKKKPRGKKNNRKREILSSMKGQESAQQDPSAEYREEITNYLDSFESVQANITGVIWPSIEDMQAASNSSLVYEAAFAVYAHLTMAPVSISGPFAYGMHALDDYEDWLISSGASNETMTLVYAIDGILIDLYQTAWRNATTALSATHLVENLGVLADYLDPRDQSLLPDDFKNVDPTGDEKYDVFLPPENRFVYVATNDTTSATMVQSPRFANDTAIGTASASVIQNSFSTGL